MSIEFEITEAMKSDPEIDEKLNKLANEVCEFAQSIAPVFGETGHDERRESPPNDEPGAYRDSIHVEERKGNHVRRVVSYDYKAIWIELGSAHMPEYAVFAKTAAHFGGTGPDFGDDVENAQQGLREEVEKLSKMRAEGHSAEAIEKQERAVKSARASRSAAFRASRRGRRR
jgi:hypothetical protein